MIRLAFLPRRCSGRLRGPVALAMLVAALLPSAEASPRAVRLPFLPRLGAALFPPNEPGYLPMVGSPALRIAGAAPAAVAIQPPPVALYTPPAPRAVAPPAETAAAEAALNTPPAETPPPAATADRPAPPLRPEDFLPYYQLNDGSSRGVPTEGLQFTPARPALPVSRAEYRQQ